MTFRRPGTCIARGLLVVLLTAAPVHGQDLAAEADLQFELGLDRYRVGDHRGALEHFLVSNRLVPNRNVVFNIARTYEQLRQYADAYRYYVLALEGETNPEVADRISGAVERITPNVAILRVVTDPPGATIFVDRRDLGPRGQAPRALAFAPGRHRILAELEGWEPAESEQVDLALGRETVVALRLVPILGKLRVEGHPPGAEVRLDRETAPAACRLPCEIEIRPGRYVVHVVSEGHDTASQVAEVRARERTLLRVRLGVLTGSLVVDADEPEALIEVDGESVGFTPAVLAVPIGSRTVRVSKPGFYVVEEVVTVSADRPVRVDASLEPLVEVAAASRATEAVEDAPSSVTVVPREELRAMAYPTVWEAMRGVRGVHVWDDRTYPTVGFRGLGRLGDYGNRVLLLQDGMPINDNLVGSSYVAEDLRTDIEDVDRIEVVRGPGSVLYGTGAFSGVMNLVTRGRGEPTGADVGVATYGDAVARARGGLRLRADDETGLWATVAVARSEGRDFYFHEFDDPAAGTDGWARGLDGSRFGTVALHGWWRDFTAQWFLHRYEKDIATAEFETLFGNRESAQTDSHGLVELRYEPHLGRRLQLFTRCFAHYYEFRGVYPYDDYYGGVDAARERYVGLWGGAELRLAATLGSWLELTVGGEVQEHPRADLHGQYDSEDEAYLDENTTSRVGAAYLLADATVSERVRLSAGARLDAYTLFGNTVNPRAAVIVRPWEGGNLKVMGGRAFRAPSVYELFYQDDGVTQIAPESLDPETVLQGEVELSQRIAARWTLLGSVFAMHVEDLVVQETTEDDLVVYANASDDLATIGGEVEVRRDWRQGWMVSASYSIQRSRYVEPGTLDPAGGREVPNSPIHMGALRAAAPVVPGAVTAATRLTVEGARWDKYDSEDDPPQRETNAAAVWDLVLSGGSDRWHLEWAAGVYNLFDWRYAMPVSREFTQRTIVQGGRTFLVSGKAVF